MKHNKPGMPEITREIYKGVKKFDRQQFTGFCRDLYGYGFEDGRASVPAVDVSKIYEAAAATKGIGPKVLAALKENIDKAFQAGETAEAGL